MKCSAQLNNNTLLLCARSFEVVLVITFEIECVLDLDSFIRLKKSLTLNICFSY